MRRAAFFTLILLFFTYYPEAQIRRSSTKGLKRPGIFSKRKCEKYEAVYNSLPADVRYGVKVEDNVIYFYFPSKIHFKKIFKNNKDGVAIDIIHKNQYDCNSESNIKTTWASKGFLMPVLYKKDFEKRTSETETGALYIKYGELPPQFVDEDIELNLLIAQKKYVCEYLTFTNIEFHNWDILEMGLYADSLSAEDQEEKYKEIEKKMHFTIPFEKNKTTFADSDIKPLYDSLKLKDYNIKSLKIRAYSSIEGSAEINEELQRKRSESIIKALQTYQIPQIKTEIITGENWVEFLNDVKNTKYDYLADLSKEEIKHKLSTNKKMTEYLESIFKYHRKGIVVFHLERKLSDEEEDPQTLIKFFEHSLAKEDLKEAIYIQQIIFSRIRNNKLPSEFLEKLDVPEASSYGPLLNNLLAFNAEQKPTSIAESIADFERLLSIMPDNLKIKYNITALKIKSWTEGELLTNRNELKALIAELENSGLEKHLLDRLWINYYIILCQYQYLEKDFEGKDASIKKVYEKYRKLNLNDQERVSIGKFLSYYSRFDLAEALLENKIHLLDVHEDLLFYYLNLTIGDEEKTKESNYRTLMLNALDKNKQRFCDIFLPISKGGVTFQLLEDEYLKSTFCENCN